MTNEHGGGEATENREKILVFTPEISVYSNRNIGIHILDIFGIGIQVFNGIILFYINKT